MKVLLTGGAGYIGSHVALSLLDDGHEVTIIDNLVTGNKRLIPKKSTFVECNINDVKKISNLLQKEKFDVLMHFAGYIKVEESITNPKKYFNNNTENAKILFQCCAENNLNNIVFSSTAATYGNPLTSELIKETANLNPINPYGESKQLVEQYLQNNQKINYMILRYFNVAGSDIKMRSGLISKNSSHLIKVVSESAVGKRKKVVIFGNDYPTIDGTAVRDYIHVSDLAIIHLEVTKHLISYKKSNILNCGYGKGFSVKEVLETANKINKEKIHFEFGSRRQGDSAMLVSNVTKLKKLINWEPKYNDLSFIIQTAIDWEKKLQNEQYT